MAEAHYDDKSSSGDLEKPHLEEAAAVGTKDQIEAYQLVDEHAKLKVDHRGLPLVPQPSDDPADPLNWPILPRIAVLFLVSLIAFNTPWNLAVSNPAFVLIGKAFPTSPGHPRTPVQGGYPSAVGIATAGIGGFFWLPFASVWGRKPTLLVALAIGTAFTAMSAASKSYGTLIAARAISGFALAAGPAIGGGVVSDLFCLHQRARAAGLFTVLLTNGPHIASLPGGFLAQYVGWQWTFWLPTITTGTLFVATLLLMPETLYIRLPGVDHHSKSLHPMRDAIVRLPQKAPTRHLTFAAFYRPIFMFRYLVVVAVCMYYSVVFTFGSVLPALTSSKTFGTYFGFGAGDTGLALSLGTTIGGVLGEVFAGPVADRLMSRARKRQQVGLARTETRLFAMLPGVFLLPAGLLIFGFTVHYYKNVSFMGPTMGAAITCFATQVVTTPVYSYLFDSYKSQSAEVAQCLNFARQTLAFTVGFWATNFGEDVGYEFSGLTYALVSLLFFLPVAAVMWKGHVIRERQGAPQFNQGL